MSEVKQSEVKQESAKTEAPKTEVKGDVVAAGTDAVRKIKKGKKTAKMSITPPRMICTT